MLIHVAKSRSLRSFVLASAVSNEAAYAVLPVAAPTVILTIIMYESLFTE